MKRKLYIMILFIIIFSSISATVAFATTFPYKREDGGNFSVWYSSSVTSYGYGGKIDTARANWGGISSNVSIGTAGSSSGSYTDELYVGTTAIAGLYGQVTTYDDTWPTNSLASPYSENYDFCIISIYNNVISDNGHLNNNDIVHVVAHELGHAASLDDTSTSSNSIMKVGSSIDWSYYTPQTYDRTDLKSQWGN